MSTGLDEVATDRPRHIPVLRDEIVTALDVRPGGTYIDATFGAGGYTRAILQVENASVLAFDRDPTAIANAGPLLDEMAGRLTLVQARFSQLAEVAREKNIAPVDGIVLDIGVSSMQLDQAERGFSFRADGPLDMRMECAGESAADLVNHLEEEALADILFRFGEERASRKIARAIAHDRASYPFTTTLSLAQMIARILPGKPGDIHPATRSFQALRIAVNDEFGELGKALVAAESILKPGGRLAVVTFHSLEDRIAKTFFASRSGRGEAASRRLPGEPEAVAPTFTVPKGQPIVPSVRETEQNPRARSAKLRFGIRTQNPARPMDEALSKLIMVPQSSARGR